jgi:protein-S-isoprenylcysteine O-methyltransferase Ste14
MDAQAAAVVALAGYVVFLLLAFGLRSVVQYRRTGATGFVGISGAAGSTEWWGGLLFLVAIVSGAAAPVLQLAGVIAPFAAFDLQSMRAAGLVLSVLGIIGTLWAQFAMGNSWRIGVDTAARTALVMSGPFRWVRNPIVTAMGAAALGLALLAPNIVSLLTLVALTVALEIQVRLVEEPYLGKVHGEDYRQYAAHTGRFLPGIGQDLSTDGHR